MNRKQDHELKDCNYARYRQDPNWVETRKAYMRDYYSRNRDKVLASQQNRDFEAKRLKQRIWIDQRETDMKTTSRLDKAKRIVQSYIRHDEATSLQVNLKNRMDQFSQLVNIELQKPEDQRDQSAIDQFSEIAQYAAIAFMNNKVILDDARARWQAIFEREYVPEEPPIDTFDQVESQVESNE